MRTVLQVQETLRPRHIHRDEARLDKLRRDSPENWEALREHFHCDAEEDGDELLLLTDTACNQHISQELAVRRCGVTLDCRYQISRTDTVEQRIWGAKVAAAEEQGPTPKGQHPLTSARNGVLPPATTTTIG